MRGQRAGADRWKQKFRATLCHIATRTLRTRQPRARARRRRFQRALRQTDLHRPAGRRCGCWPTSTFLFRGIVVGSFGGRTMELGRSAPMLMSASPGRGGGDGAGAGRAQPATGSSTTIAKFRSTDSGASSSWLSSGPASLIRSSKSSVGFRVAIRLERSPPSRTRAAIACTNTGAEGPASDARLHVRGPRPVPQIATEPRSAAPGASLALS